MSRINVLGVPLDNMTVDEITAGISERADASRTILAMNPEKVFLLRRHPELTELYRNAYAVVGDGVGMRVACRLLHHVAVPRITGADLMLILIGHAANTGMTVALLGGSEAVNTETVRRLSLRFPGLKIVFHRNGFFADAEAPEIAASIASAQPDITFIGLGSPKQELFVTRWGASLGTGTVQCVGGTFDTIAGTVRRAPQWMQQIGCEWLYRLLSQPSRFRRQARLVPFMAMVAGELLQTVLHSTER